MKILFLICVIGAAAGCAFSHQTIIKVSGNDVKYSWPNSFSGNQVNVEIDSNATYDFASKHN